jgi:hypothetical protein
MLSAAAQAKLAAWMGADPILSGAIRQKLDRILS